MLSLLSKTLSKTTSNLIAHLGSKKDKLSRDELEELLIECDIEYELIEELLDSLPPYIGRESLHKALKRLLSPESTHEIPHFTESYAGLKPLATLIIGVNGAGKTTTIAKLAKRAQSEGKSVMLAAGDTFRAAAIEQLKLWGQKLNVPVIATQHMHDPSALAFDSITSARAKGIDELYIDTAGRLHTQTNLNNELLKIVRVSEKAMQGQGVRKFLVLDGTQGSSAIAQARAFSQQIDCSGIILTKLDGTSKGGAVFSIVRELGIPIIFIGVGEREDDLIAFEADSYISTLLDSLYTE